MSKELFAQQEIAPKTPPRANLEVSGQDFLQTVEPEKTNTNSKAKKIKIPHSAYEITILAVFIAIGVVLNITSSTFPKIDFFGRFSLIYSYCTLCGIILGAVRGGICAALSDMMVAFIVPESGMIWMPLITISNFFMAFIPGVIYRISKQKLDFTIFVSAIISFVVCTLGFTAAGETLLYSYLGAAPYYPSVTVLVKTGIPVYFAFVIRKAIIQPFWIILNLVIAKLMLKSPALNNMLRAKKRR